MNLKEVERKINFQLENVGYGFIGLILLALVGFWPSYFSLIFRQSHTFSFYFHFHVIVVTLWIIGLIVQPILIKTKRLRFHRLIGKFSYGLFPMLVLSVVLVAHSRHSVSDNDLPILLFIPFKDLCILIVGYLIAVFNRKNLQLHARGMIVTGIVFIEPPLIRFVSHSIAPFPAAYFITISCVLLVLVILILTERNQKNGRWIFPLILGLYAVFYLLISFEVTIAPWNGFAKWFIQLPITY